MYRKEYISSLAAFNSYSRYLILPSWYLAWYWYLQDMQSHGMLFSVKLGMVFAQFMWNQQLELTQI